jgi:hypothetical protein
LATSRVWRKTCGGFESERVDFKRQPIGPALQAA